MNNKITIVDYGVGNLQSLKKAFKFLGAEALVSEEPEEILSSDAVVLPGVGSFEAGMRGLKLRNLTRTVKKYAEEGKPMLGICLGAQIMLDRGYEFGKFDGLGIIPGAVSLFPELENKEKVPQIGWNKVFPAGGADWGGSIFNGLNQNPDFYFVHSYIMSPQNPENIFGLTSYGGLEFCSVIRRGNIYGVQFHPEKSGKAGLEVIRNFIALI